MRFTILGSGGCVSTPKPLCQCPVCVEAREKGYPYARCGCSLFLEDISLLVDTPEDISIAINNADIRKIAYVLYSHWDPDHTMGMRVIEQLRLEWLDHFKNIKPENPLMIYTQTDVMEDLKRIRSKYGSFLSYYENMGLAKLGTVENNLLIGNVKITFLSVPGDKAVTVFVFEENGKKFIYAPCDCIPFPQEKLLENADVLVIGNTFIGDVMKNGEVLSETHPLRQTLHSFESILAMKERLNIKKLVITHIEECWGKSFVEYQEMEKQYMDVFFAYDGMKITV